MMGTRVMVVEDERIVALHMRQQLQKLGYDVSSIAASGEQALRQIETLLPDIVLMDINIEGDLDGIETASRIPANLNTPVIYLTAYSEDATLERARATKPYGYLLKPFSERELHATIQMALERRRADTALRESEQRLERTVEERTAELRAANEELEAFCYSVSHDLRAPLRSIDGFSLALLEDYGDKLDAEGADYLQRVRAATQRMGRLIDDLLNFSRISRREMRHDAIDLTHMADGIITELGRANPGRAVAFTAESGLWAMGDRGLIGIVLENLLGNAWKFTAKQPNAKIEFTSGKDGDERYFFVRDNGAGFDMAYADKLFAPFQRLHRVTDFDGNGIGLATIKRIVNRHGGRVWAEGEVGRGATIYFTIPG